MVSVLKKKETEDSWTEASGTNLGLSIPAKKPLHPLDREGIGNVPTTS